MTKPYGGKSGSRFQLCPDLEKVLNDVITSFENSFPPALLAQLRAYTGGGHEFHIKEERDNEA